MTREEREMMAKEICSHSSHMFLIWMMAAGFLVGGCSKDMEEQPSFSFQEAPRLHSPQGSVPHAGPAYARKSATRVAHGPHLFAINCAHCHGERGMGDGAVAGYLPDVPANLHALAVQQKSDAVLYSIVTNGEKVMPAFERFLSNEERWALVAYLRTFRVPAPSSNTLMQETN